MRQLIAFFLMVCGGIPFAFAQQELYVVDQFDAYHEAVVDDPNHQLVDLTAVIPNLVLDIRYATTNNFTGVQIYEEAGAFARVPVAEALRSVQDSLFELGLGLKIFDAYRPYSATVKFYEVYPDSTFVADPKKGSRHNRGCAVDLTLVDLRSGLALEMPTPYDDFTEKAHFEYKEVTSEAAANRELLHNVMTHFGFEQYPAEWWHFDYKDWRNYTLTDLSFDEIILYNKWPPAAIDSLVEKAMSKMKVVGAAVALVKNGKLYYERGYGVRSVSEGQPVEATTNFAIASNTKAFTAAALTILVEEGKLKWTDRVVEHLPEFKMYNDYVTEHFIIEDLLTHRSGLGLGAGDLMFFPDGTDFTIQDVLTNFQYFQPATALRTRFDYDNVLYLVAGELVKRVAGMTWEEFVKRRLLEPLGMSNSYATIHEIPDRRVVAVPHEVRGGEWVEVSHFEKRINGAAGGIYSNVHDLAEWMKVQLNRGRYGLALERELWSEGSHYQMWSVKTAMGVNRSGPRAARFRGYGLGWFLSDAGGVYRVEHTGGLPGMLSKTLLLPGEDFGLVILTNTSPDGGAFFEAVSESVVDVVVGERGMDWVGEMAGYLEASRQEGDAVLEEVWARVEGVDQSGANWEGLVGRYEDLWFGEVVVERREGRWWLRCVRSPRLNGPLYWVGGDVFAVRWEYQEMNCDAYVKVTFGKNGMAEELRMEGISPNMDFSFDFQDLRLVRK